MTNKPMLSVERELLERVTDNMHIDKESISIRRWEAICKLRAILSRQVCAKCGNPTACEKPVCEDCCYEMPAAHHHSTAMSFEKIRYGIADFLADNMPMKKYTLAEVERMIKEVAPTPTSKVEPDQ